MAKISRDLSEIRISELKVINHHKRYFFNVPVHQLFLFVCFVLRKKLQRKYENYFHQIHL